MCDCPWQPPPCASPLPVPASPSLTGAGQPLPGEQSCQLRVQHCQEPGAALIWCLLAGLEPREMRENHSRRAFATMTDPFPAPGAPELSPKPGLSELAQQPPCSCMRDAALASLTPVLAMGREMEVMEDPNPSTNPS